MKYLGVVILSLVFACGCHQTQPPKMDMLVRAKPSISPMEKVDMLRTGAKKRGIRWIIFCIPKSSSEEETYQADAFQADDRDTENRYVEDGAKDWWSETASTPEEAAYLLSISIQSPPEMGADHKADVTSGSCNFNIVLDSKHEGQIPCTRRGSK